MLLARREAGVLLPLVFLFVTVGSINSAFFGVDNLINMLRAASFTFIAAIGTTMVLIAAGLDLSVGSLVALGSYTTALALTSSIPVPLAVLIGMLTGGAVGMASGGIIVAFRIPPFITTLGMLYMVRGVVLIASKGVPIYPLPDAFNAIGQSALQGIPYIVIIAAGLGLAAEFMLRCTIFGRAIYAVGGNEETARLSGIAVDKVKISIYAVAGCLATITGLLQASRLGSAQPSIGNGFELQAIAAAIIGGTSLFGGAGTILGTLLGTIFMTVMTSGMSFLRVSAYWQQLVIGAIIVVSVGLDQFRRRRL